MAYVIDIWKYGVSMSECGYLIEEDSREYDTLEEAMDAFNRLAKTEKGHEDYSYLYEVNLFDASTGACLRTGWFN